MNTIVEETADWLAALPQEEQELIHALVKRLVFAWDPYFTKLTAKEKERLEQAQRELDMADCSDFITDEDVWN